MVCGQLLVLAPIQHRWVLVPILFQAPWAMGQCSASWSHCFLTRKKCNVPRSGAADGSGTLHHQKSAGTSLLGMSLLGHRNITARMSSSEDVVCAPAHPNARRSLAAHRPFRSGCLWDVHDLQQSHLQSLASERSVKPGQLLHAGRVAGGSLEEGRNQRLWWTHRRKSRVERSDSGSA